MANIAVVTDSISCIPASLVKEFDIRIVPVGLVIDRKVYPDTQLANDEFWKLFYSTHEPITTNAGNPVDFEAVFTELAQNSDSIICVPVSKQLSATYSMACQARDSLIKKLPDLKIEVIDSKTSTGAQGFIVLEAVRAARAGKSLPDVVEITQEMTSRVRFLSALSTLKYLRRCGRAPKSAFIGDWLKVKPILGMVNGSGLVENLGREIGMDKAVNKMIEMVANYIDPGQPLHLMVHYSDDRASGENIRDLMTARYQCSEVFLTPYTPVMTSQTGPILAVAFYQ